MCELGGYGRGGSLILEREGGTVSWEEEGELEGIERGGMGGGCYLKVGGGGYF